MKLALQPVNIRVGDFEGNLEIHRARVRSAAKDGADLVVFPELSLVGYFPRDLLVRPSWASQCEKQLQEFHSWLQKEFPKIAVVVGTSLPVEASGSNPKGLANCAVFLCGDAREVRAKTLLPYYDVFTENRYFDSAENLPESFRAPIEFGGRKLGLLVCEDSWDEMKIRGRNLYRGNPTRYLKEQGCNYLINISASPYERTKKNLRRETIASDAKEFSIPIAYVNLFGAQDEILFDGDAFLFDSSGSLASEKQRADAEPLWLRDDGGKKPSGTRPANLELETLRTMLVLGIRDYLGKNGFKRIVLGLSGGIDSALVAALACEAVGPENVMALAMPSKYSSVHSIDDAEAMAHASGLKLHHFPIKMPHSTMSMALKPFFSGLPEDATEENLQSRLRGTAVMAFSNKFQALALATGNKSEFAMGYSTLYGDMCGAIAPIGDLYKTEVYELARYVNESRKWIPENTFTKAPSAELKPNQTDQDTLPPYDLLDAALKILLEEELDPPEALAQLKKSFPKADLGLLEKIQKTIRANEHKRRQAPLILRVSGRAFGPGRPYPLSCRY
ncbi:MAG: NAD+ synthase [Bdellovibrionota bacterium]